MEKNKKIIILCVAIALIVITVVTIVILSSKGEEQKVEQANIQEEDGTSKLTTLRDTMKQNANYSVSLKLNDENKRTTIRENNNAYIEIIDEGEKSTYIIKDNTTYLLLDSTKKYYEYKNNVSLLNEFINNMNEVLKLKYEIGTEEIDGKQYRYEEFKGTSAFIINYKRNIDNEDTKTRLYFSGNDLKYIKTYVGDVEQLLDVEIKFGNQNNNSFEIPEEYSKN